MKPKYVQSLTVLLWGFQTELLAFAVPMALLLEPRYFINRRWALGKQDFYRIADLTSLGLVALILYLFLNAREFHFITTLIKLLPLVFFPLVVVLAYSTSERMTLDVLFYSLRRQKEPVKQSWDMDYFFIGVCLLATGTSTSMNVYYLPIAALLICWSLFPLRSSRYQTSIWFLMASIVFLSAWLTQTGIKQGQEALKHQSARWIANFLMNRTDPMKTTTALGNVGRMKMSDTILFRLQGNSVPPLLQEASYDLPSGTNWLVLNPSFQTVPHADDFLWHLAGPGDSDDVVDIYLEFDREQAIVPVPDSVTAIRNLPATDIKASQYGSVQATGLVPSPGFKLRFNETANLNSEPRSSDHYIPAEYTELLNRVTQGRQFSDDRQALAWIRRFFSDFRYSLYQSDTRGDPLGHFLMESRQGHCEYFASATTLLLRQLGIPARYVVGYAVQEYNASLDMYLVRQRHAHSWTIGYIDGEWRVVDTTPAVWAEEEASQAGRLQPVYDFINNRIFLFQRWWNEQQLEDYKLELIILGCLLAVVLIWRIASSEQVILGRNDTGQSDQSRRRQGHESPFFRIQDHLEEAGYHRGRGEVTIRWLERIERRELIPLLQIHNRWRFDPAGIDEEEKRALDRQVRHWLANQSE